MLGIVYHVGYLTDDLTRAVAFYQETFGGRIVAQVSAGDGAKIAYVKVGDSEVELIEPADKSRLGGKMGLALDHVGYFVPDIDKAIADLKSRGVEFASAEPTVSAVGYRMIYLEPASTLGTRLHLTELKRQV